MTFLIVWTIICLSLNCFNVVFLKVQLTINALFSYQGKHNMSELMTIEALEAIQQEEF